MTEDARPDPVETAYQRLMATDLTLPADIYDILRGVYQAGYDAGEGDRRDDLPTRLRPVT